MFSFNSTGCGCNMGVWTGRSTPNMHMSVGVLAFGLCVGRCSFTAGWARAKQQQQRERVELLSYAYIIMYQIWKVVKLKWFVCCCWKAFIPPWREKTQPRCCSCPCWPIYPTAQLHVCISLLLVGNWLRQSATTSGSHIKASVVNWNVFVQSFFT